MDISIPNAIKHTVDMFLCTSSMQNTTHKHSGYVLLCTPNAKKSALSANYKEYVTTKTQLFQPFFHPALDINTKHST